MPFPAQRLKNLPPYVFAILGDRIRQMELSGVDVIRLDIGNPDMPPPNTVIEALAESAHQPGNHGYSGYRGTPSFRQAVARYYKRRFDVEINPDTQILPLLGSKEGLVNLCLAYLDDGDIALIPDIGYPSYMQGTRLAGADVHWLSLTEANNYVPDLSTVPPDVAKKAKLLWINYPNNPTGATVELDFYRDAVEFCKRHDILLVSDNPYVDVTFDGYRAGSVLQVNGAADFSLEFISLSKSHNMAGWRLGAAVGSPNAINTLLQIKSNIDSGHFKAIYDAGAAALDETDEEWIERRNLIYQKRRDRILDVLPEIGLSARKPKGSLYVWAKVVNGDVHAYLEDALLSAHVSLAPGNMYGPGGEEYVRLSVGVSDKRLDAALTNLKEWFSKR